MHQRTWLVSGVAAVASVLAVSACHKDQSAEQQLAPTASALSAAKPAAPEAVRLHVVPSSSRFTFSMDSPLEKIDGDAPQSLEGELFVDPKNLTESTALLKADLKLLTLYQQKRGDEAGAAYSSRKKSDLQNEHARDWLQLQLKPGEVTAEQAEMNRFAELKIDRLENPSASDVTQLTGAERKVSATAVGEFRLHGRKVQKKAKVELVFKYAGTKLETVSVKTLEPFVITLEQFEIHPRDAAGKFVKSLSDAISSNLKGKVAKDAPVEVSFTASVL